MSKGCARSSKKGCGGRAAGQVVHIDDSFCGVIRARAAIDVTEFEVLAIDHFEQPSSN